MKNIVDRLSVEVAEKWDSKVGEIPAITFPTGWSIKIIPPFAGATVRFTVWKDDEQVVSVYLDMEGNLGFYGTRDGGPEPYWEIYPYGDGVYRVAMADTNELVKRIQMVLNGEDES